MNNQNVKKLMLTVVGAMLAAGVGTAQDRAYLKTKVPDAKGRQVAADLIFRDGIRTIEVSADGRMIAEVPYDTIGTLSYEYTTHLASSRVRS